MLPETLALIAFGGFVIGILIGMTGVGGGSLTTPMLISGFGIAPALAVGTDLLFAAITKLSAAWRHHAHSNVDWPILGYMAFGSLSSSLATLAWFRIAGPDMALLSSVITTMLAGALVISAVAISVVPWWLRRRGGETTLSVAARPVPTVLYGALVGALVTVTSVGAGAVGVAVLTLLYPQLVARRIVGTDIVHAIPLALVSGLGHLSMGHVEVTLLGSLLAGSIPGIVLGSRAVTWLPEHYLRGLLSLVLIYAACVVHWHTH